MPVQWQNISIDFGQGIDEKSDRKATVPGKLEELVDGIFTKTRSLTLRPGTLQKPTAVTSGGNITRGRGVTTLDDELLAFDGERGYSFSEQRQEWTDKGIAKECNVAKGFVADNGTSIAEIGSVAQLNGLEVAVYSRVDALGDFRLYITATDVETGDRVISDDLIAGAESTVARYMRLVPLGTDLMIIYRETTLGQIRALRFDTTTLAAPVVAWTTADASAGVLEYDAIGISSTEGILVYSNSTAGSATIVSFSSTALSGTKVRTFGAEPQSGLAVGDDNNGHFFAAWVDTLTTLQVQCAQFNNDATLTIHNAGITIEAGITNALGILHGTIVATATPGTMQYYYSVDLGDGSGTKRVDITDAPSVTGPTLFSTDTEIIGKAFRHNGTNYVPIVALPQVGACGLLLDENRALIAEFFPLEYGYSLGGMSDAVSGTGPSVKILGRKAAEIAPTGTVFVYDLVVLEFQFEVAERLPTARALNNLAVSSGLPLMYDKNKFVEYAFVKNPDVEDLGAGSGGNLNSGTYSWAVVYRWDDDNGVTHRSAPSNIITVSAPNNSTRLLRIANYTFGDRDNVTIELYSTEQNSPNLVFLTSFANDPTLPTQDFTDNIDHDTGSLANNLPLYTSTGELPNTPPPAGRMLVLHERRLFLVVDRNEIWFTKKSTGTSTGEFNELFRVQITEEGGPIVSLASFEGVLLIFKREAILTMAGDGPDIFGVGAFGSPRILSEDVGCKDPRSISESANGIVFASAKGVYQVNRGFQVGPIGFPVEERVVDGEVRHAQLLEERSQIRYLVNGLSTSRNHALVHDYHADQWSLFGNSATTPYQKGIESTVWKGTYGLIQETGEIVFEQPAFADTGMGYGLRVTTGWIKPTGQGGFVRIRRLILTGNRIDVDFTIRIEVFYDYDDVNVAQTITKVVDASSVPLPLDPFQLRMRLSRQKCAAIKFRITPTATFGEAYSLSNMMLEMAPKRGLNRLPAAKTIGG